LNYPNTETILIDDGSTDNTAEITSTFPWVKYFYQNNSGLPASRNKGTSLSRGEFIVYLDADDWLYPNAITSNLVYLLANPALAIVSGCHNISRQNGEVVDEGSDTIDSDHYIHLLYRNYIGNPAAVLYRRSIAEEFPFDTSPEVKACEDYDQYLKIARKYQILHHQEKICVYRKHGDNMSDNAQLMLTSVLNVLRRQEPFLEHDNERNSWIRGKQQWTRKYTSKLYRHIFEKMGILNLTRSELKQISVNKKEFIAIFLIKIKSHLTFRYNLLRKNFINRQ
jgi:glycosyltransferase involved in cell wall biosynthesis